MTSAVAIHEEDAGILLVFVILLTCVVITIWALKKKSVRFLHETGLALIYGLIIGAIIRYATPKSSDDNQKNDVIDCDNLTKPDEVILIKINQSELRVKYFEKKFISYRMGRKTRLNNLGRIFSRIFGS